MKYSNIMNAITAYRSGKNVVEEIKKQNGESFNTDETIEVVYDLRSGSYEKHKQHDNYTDELASILSRYTDSGDRVFEAGAGELSVLSSVANKISTDNITYAACDLSWSRIRCGTQHISGALELQLADAFVANFFHLPLADKSVDVVFTSHSLEPNGGREKLVLTELIRITRKKLLLFEPSYEHATDSGKSRMLRHGYARNIPEAIAAAGGRLDALIRIDNVFNILNPTYAYVVTPRSNTGDTTDNRRFWACPVTKLEITKHGEYFWCEESGLCYPVLKGIPVLRPDAAILASAF